jgi:hypothetical protein
MKRIRQVFAVLLILAYVPIIGVVLFMWSTGFLGELFRGPKVVQSVPSPDSKYVAYVQDWPSIDPPNQSLVVERADKTRFLGIADLAEDVDSIRDIVWSADSGIVVFLSHCYLTATRVSDWKTVRIYLGKEWMRSRPSRRSTFCGAQPIRKVNAVEFPSPDTVAYQIDDGDEWHMIQMNSTVQQPTELGHSPSQAVHACGACAPQLDR